MESLKKIRYLAVGSSILVVVMGALLLHPSARPLLEGIFGQGELAAVDFDTLVLSGDQDEYLACGRGLCPMSEPHQDLEAYSVPLNQLREALLSAIDSSPTFFRRSLDLARQQFEFTDRVMNSPFPDVVTIRFFDLENGRSSFAIYSRTVSGRPEAGRNEARVKRLLDTIESLGDE